VPQPVSARHEAAIDVVGLAGDVAAARGGEEHRHRGDVVRCVGAADRDARLLLGQELLDRDAALGGAGDGIARAELGARDAGADSVDVDVVTAELLRRGMSEPDVKKVLGENLLRVLDETTPRP